MRYIRVLWRHDHPDEPIELFSELDGVRWKVRKVEQFRDGRLGYASATESTESTGLGLEHVLALEIIARDSQFISEEISPAEFEAIWSQAHTVAPTR